MASLKDYLKRFWRFLWYDDSVASWIVTTALAFILIKFVVYPGLGWLLGTPYPIVAVVSGSMEHNAPFDTWWAAEALCHERRCTQGEWYEEHTISKEQFKDFSFSNGFNTGDIIVLYGTKPKNINIGNVIVFQSTYKVEPIIHRVIQKTDVKDIQDIRFYTKGDNNKVAGDVDKEISEAQYLGKAWFRIPYLGWIKIGFVKLMDSVGITGLYEKIKEKR